MARTNRVRHTPTHLLEVEAASLMLDWKLDGSHPDWLMDGHCRLCSRWFRVMREVTRRDYRFRAHGRACTCSECLQLLDEWTTLNRGARAQITPRD